MIKYAIIVAVDSKYGMSKDGQLPWHYPDDLKYFRHITGSHPCVMGRLTYEDINKRLGSKALVNVLPNRQSFVLSNTLETLPNAHVIKSLQEVEQFVDKNETVFVIGGLSVYQEAIPLVDELYITYIKKDYDSDMFFPVQEAIKGFTVSNVIAPNNGCGVFEELLFVKYQRKNHKKSFVNTFTNKLHGGSKVKLMEIAKTKKGTYAGVKFDDKTNKSFVDYIKANKIPNPLSTEKLHTTLLYSRKYLPNYKPQGTTKLVGKPKEFVVWETNDDASKKARCLVLKYECPELEKRHKDLMDEHKATYDYDEYCPHVTLSYDIGDFDEKKLPDIKKFVSAINIVDEYGEDLDLDWTGNNA